MTDIKIKVKDKEPSDENITKRKDFSSVYDGYISIKSSYAKVASLWGATIGMTVFLAFAATETLGTKSNDIEELSGNNTGTGPQTTKQIVNITQPTYVEVAPVEVENNIPIPDPVKQTIVTEEDITVQEVDKTKITETRTENEPATVVESKKINAKFIPQD